MKETIYKIMSGIYIMLGVTGMLLSFTHAFEIHYMEKTVYGALVMVCILTVGVFGRKKRTDKWIVWGSLFAGAVVMWMLDKESFISSREYVENRIVSMVSRQLGNGRNSNFHIGARDGEDVLIWIFAVLMAVIAWEVMREKHLWLTESLLGISFLIPFILRKEPKNSEVLLILIAMLGLLSMKATGRKGFGIPGVLAGVTAFSIGAVFLAPTLQPVFQETKQAKKEPLSAWSEQMEGWFQGKSASGGIGDGKVGEYDELVPGREEQLIVTTDTKPLDEIYLQGFIGTSYDGNEWKPVGANAFKKWSKREKTDAREVRNLPFQGLGKSGKSLTIENTGANTKYRYMPYFSWYDETISLRADTYAKGEKEKEYKVIYGMEGNLEEKFSESNELEEAYYEFVKEEYTKVPRNIEDAFAGVVEELDGRSFDAIVDEVTRLLMENASYSLKPGATPLGKDAVEYFYFENKKGYCEHFASTATLLLRMKGIPARFVTGYVVRLDKFKKATAGGYRAVVTGKEAHAWAEAYVEGLGWIPVETTPGYGNISQWDNQQMFQNKQEEIEKEKEEQKQEEKKEEKEKQGEEDGQKEQKPIKEAEGKLAESQEPTKTDLKERGKTLYAALGVLAVFAVSCIAVVLVRRHQLIQRRKKEKKENYEIRTKRLFYQVFDMLVTMRFVKQETELDDAFIEKVSNGCSGIEEADLKKFLEIVYKANFGNEMVTDKEYYLCRKIEQTIKKEFIAKISIWKKLWWKYWKGIL